MKEVNQQIDDIFETINVSEAILRIKEITGRQVLVTLLAHSADPEQPAEVPGDYGPRGQDRRHRRQERLHRPQITPLSCVDAQTGGAVQGAHQQPSRGRVRGER